MSLAPDMMAIEKHLNRLAVDIGPRESGSARADAAIDYLSACLDGFEVDWWRHEFHGPAWEHLGTRLVLEATGENLPAHACTFSPPCDIRADLCPLGALAGDAPSEVAGRVCLADVADLSWPDRTELIREIIAGADPKRLIEPREVPAGRPGTPVADLQRDRAAALLVAPRLPPANAWDGKLVCEPSLRHLPVASVSRDVRDHILEVGGPLSLRIEATYDPWALVPNLLARIGDPAGGRVFVVAHYDTGPGTPGATDDATGTAIALELLRLFSTDPPDRELFFLLTGLEEWAGLGGVMYVRDHAETVRASRYLVNLDDIGVRSGSLSVQICGPAALARSADDLVSRWPEVKCEHRPRLGGDGWAFTDPAIGLPGLWPRHRANDPHYAELRHTQLDAMDVVDLALVEQAARIAASACVEL